MPESVALRPVGDMLRGPLPVVVLLTILAILLVTSMWSKSPTVDEYAHLPAGLSALRFGDLELYGKTPPLARELFCLPSLATTPELPPALAGNRMAGWYPWRYADLFFTANVAAHGIDFTHGLYRRARLMVAAMTLLLALAVYAWGRAAWGPQAGLIALAFLVVDPNLIAHGRLATTDAPITLGFVAAVGLLVVAMVRPRPLPVIAAGLAAGAALATKFTAILLAPVWLGLALVAVLGYIRGRERRPLAPLAVVAGAGLVAIAVLAASYGFTGLGLSLRRLPLASHGMQAMAASPLGGVPLPLPALWLVGLDAQRADLEYVEWPNYLHGTWSDHGWWYYYPLALMLKTPLGAIALAVIAAAGWLGRRLRPAMPQPPATAGERLSCWAIGLTLAVLLGVAITGTRVQTGIRWVLPAIPFIALGVGAGLRRARGRTAAVITGCWLAATAATAAAFPHYLAFFNLAAGGRDNGRQWLASSNIDWGQDLVYLRRELARRGIDEIRLAYFGHADPADYGVRYTVPLPGASGADAVRRDQRTGELAFAPGWYAISVNHLLGQPYIVNDHGRWLTTASDRSTGNDLFRCFRDREPQADIGGSILLYRVME